MKFISKRKLSMIATIISSLVMVGTASVATFAWFTATASAQVKTKSTSVDITVAAPDDIEVDTPEIYMYRGDPSEVTISNYTQVSTVEARTITSNFYPGQTITFAIKVTATTGSISIGSMNLTYQGYSLSNRTIYGTSGANVISILSAMKISTGANSTGAYPTMTEKLTPIARGSELTLASLTQVDATTSYYKQATISNAINNASIGGNVGYFFYRIDFVNTPSSFYVEKNSTGSSTISTPVNDDETRFFTGSDTGSSTCYEGLKFYITKAAIKVA